ncbi:MAG: type II toxin-antitoxin system Phd/YefM family antitoxin [Thermomicrobiales bacterium]
MVAEPKTWSVAEAKTHLSQVIDRALHDGPQTITRRGRETVVIVSAEEWARKTKRKGTLLEFFQNSPLRGSGIVIERIHDEPRKIDL